MRATRVLGVVFLPCLALVGCGSDDEPSDSDDTVTATAPADDDPDETSEDGADEPDETPAGELPSAGAGTCSVTISGDVSAEWTSTATGLQAFVYGPWVGVEIPDDQSSFGLNCYDEDFNIVGFLAKEGVEIPMEPASYPVGEPGGPETIEGSAALLFDESVAWDIVSGTLDIAEFDDSHISGTFSLVIEDTFDPTRTADVNGEFAHSR